MSLELLIEAEDRASFAPGELELLELTYTKAYPGLFLNAEVSLVSALEIQKLNKEFRSLDTATDVLSFPTFQTFDELEKAAKGIPSLIGSIVICPEKATIYTEELIDLVHHGLLHLLGFDHEADRVQWNTEEERLLGVASDVGLDLNGIPDDSI